MNKLNCYKYSIKKNDQVVKSGFIHASNDAGLEGRLKNEVLPKVSEYTSSAYSQAFCRKCGSDYDVTNFHYDNKEYVLCRNCRFTFFKL